MPLGFEPCLKIYIHLLSGILFVLVLTKSLTLCFYILTTNAIFKAKGLKGAMIWELSRGFVSGASDTNPYLTALGNNLLR
jgi:hypothetical protein